MNQIIAFVCSARELCLLKHANYELRLPKWDSPDQEHDYLSFGGTLVEGGMVDEELAGRCPPDQLHDPLHVPTCECADKEIETFRLQARTLIKYMFKEEAIQTHKNKYNLVNRLMDKIILYARHLCQVLPVMAPP